MYVWLEGFIRAFERSLDIQVLPEQIEMEIEALEGERRCHPLDISLLMKLGVKYLQVKKYDKAAECFRLVRGQDPGGRTAPRAIFFEGLAYLLRGKTDEALEIFRECRRKGQDNYRTRLMSAVCNYLLRDSDQAYRELERAERMERERSAGKGTARLCRALFLENDRRYDEAKTLYRDIINEKVGLGELARERLTVIEKRDRETERLRKKARMFKPLHLGAGKEGESIRFEGE